MKNETRKWLEYADENLRSAQILMDSGLYNPCLQNLQQGVEKWMKAVLVELSGKFIKTHSIAKLKHELEEIGTLFDITDDECDLLDTIYLPSKYPVVSAIPDYDPDLEICKTCVEIAMRVEKSALKIIDG